MDLQGFDFILINSSAGKDSQAMLDYLAEMIATQRTMAEVIVVHADLGRVEWAGTKELAEKQARHYGFRFEVVARDGDLLDQIIDRRISLDAKSDRLHAAADDATPNVVDALSAAVAATLRKKGTEALNAAAWPSSKARFCTSDQKTGQVEKLMTRLVDQSGIVGRPVRILNCLGIRAEESPARAKKQQLHRDSASNGKREVTRWLPIFTWTTAQVWERINASGVAHHPAYDLGMSRLSCVFCVFASKADLTIAAKHNPELAKEYVEVEIQVRSTFRADLSMADVIAAAEAA